MSARALPLLVSLSLLGCPAAEEPPSERTQPQPRSEPAATEPEHVNPIEPVEGLIGSIGLPKHVEFTLANAGAQPLRIALTGIDHGGERRTRLAVGEIQWWPAEAAEPRRLALDEVLELAPGVVGQLTIYLGTWPQAAIDAGDVDAMSDRFRLIGRFRVDEVDSDVTAIVRRGTKSAAPPRP
jgi:hypothetical protein